MDTPVSQSSSQTTPIDLNPISLSKESITIFKKKWLKFLVLLLLSVLASLPVILVIIVLVLATTSLFGKNDIVNNLPMILLSAGGLLLSYCVVVAIAIISQMTQLVIAHDSGNMSVVSAVKYASQKFFPYLWVSFLSGLLITGGFFLFLIPGIIFSIWFGLACYVVLFEGKTGMSALFTSKAYMKGNIMRAFVAIFVLLVFIIVINYLPPYLISTYVTNDPASIALTIATYLLQVITGPLITIYVVSMYRRLREAHRGSVVMEKKAPYIITALLGYLIPLLLIIISLTFLSRFITSYLNNAATTNNPAAYEEKMLDGDDTLLAPQFAKANNTMRRSHLNLLLNALYSYQAENKGDLPKGLTTKPQEIANVDNGLDLCSELYPKYLSEMPLDPKRAAEYTFEDCDSEYATGYTIYYTNSSRSATMKRIHITAPLAEEDARIEVSR